MSRLFVHIIIVLFVLVLQSGGGLAQDVDLRNFAFYTQKDGLSNYNIHKILQDNKSFLWLATQDGLNRFDGTSFTVYNKGLEPKRALFANDIRDLIYDAKENVLWVICNEGGINGIDIITGTVKYAIAYNNKLLETAWRICACAYNYYIYIGTSQGLEVFDTRTKTFEQQQLLSSNYPVGFRSSDIRALTLDKNKNLWVHVLNKGILIYNPRENRMIKSISPWQILENNHHLFWPLCGTFMQDGNYWLGTKSGLYKLTYSKDYSITSHSLNSTALASFLQQDINALMPDSKGNLIIAADALYKYDIAQNKLLHVIPANKNDERWTANITYCYEDKEADLWIGYKQGLGQMKSNKPAFISIKNSSIVNNKLSHVYGLCAFESNVLLAGTQDGLYLLKDTNEFSQLIGGRLIQNIFKLRDKDVVISGNRGIQLFTNGRIIPIGSRYREFLPFKEWQLNSRAVLSDSTIILGTESNDGILVWNIKKHTIINIRDTSKNSLLSNNVNTIFASKSKQAFVLADYGITVLNNDYSTRQIVLKNSINKPMGILMDMAETPDSYWINAYGEGLIKLDKQLKPVKVFGLKEGISSTSLYKIFNYKDSLLVLTSNNGISVFDVHKETFRTYFEEDGLQDNTFEEACGDTYKDLFYAGGVEGMVIINPSNFTTSGSPPELYVTALKVQRANNKLIDTTNLYLQTFDVPNDVLQTSIYFSGLYYNNPKRVQYAYRIKENAKDWIYLHTQNIVSLPQLPAGTHTLQIKASNEDGVWSEIKELRLNYLPKWYETVWFDIAVAILITAILYGFYKYRINDLKKQQLIRRNIASDLHDDIGSTLNTVKVFTHLAKREMNKAEYLDQIEKSLSEATAGLRDMIWVLDDKQDTIYAVIDRIKQFTIPVTDANSINFECYVEAENKDWKISKTEKRNLMLMIKESINNSIKYAECRNIKVIFKKDKNKQLIEVLDDGKGFDEANIVRGNGLQNLQYRAEQIRCKVAVISSPGKGTLVKIEKNNR